MTKIGQEVTQGKNLPPVQLPPARGRRSGHVLDLRQPAPATPPAAPRRPRPASVVTLPGPERQSIASAGASSGIKAAEDRDSARLPTANLPATPSQDSDGVRSHGGVIAAAPIKKKWRPFAKRANQSKAPRKRITRKQLAIHAIKLAIVLAGAVGFLSLGVSLAERFIGIYFVVAVVYAIDSQRTFLVALVFLVMVAVWSALGNSVSAEDYAIYAFYFLVIGLLSAIREMVFTKNQPETQPPSVGK